MVSTIEVARFLRNEFPNLNIFPIEFPLNSPVNSCIVEVQGNVEARAGVFPLIVQIKVKDEHPAKAEETSFLLRNSLENKTNFIIGGVQVIFVKSQNPMPLAMGKDVNGKYLYSNNFRFMINEGE